MIYCFQIPFSWFLVREDRVAVIRAVLDFGYSYRFHDNPVILTLQ
jgi:hypothetical protein